MALALTEVGSCRNAGLSVAVVEVLDSLSCKCVVEVVDVDSVEERMLHTLSLQLAAGLEDCLIALQ